MLRRALFLLTLAAGALSIFAATYFIRPSDTSRGGTRTPLSTEQNGRDRQVPDLLLHALDGRGVRLHDVRGTPLVVNSWAAWCLFCEKELLDLAAVQQEYGDRVRFIAIDRGEDRATVQEYLERLGLSDDLLVLLDPDDAFYRSIGGFSMPETLFVRADGTLQFHKRGVMTREEIQARTAELVASP